MFLNPALSEDGDRKWVKERAQIKTTSTSAIKTIQIQENIHVKLMRALVLAFVMKLLQSCVSVY